MSKFEQRATDNSVLETRKERVQIWFTELRDQIHRVFEQIEADAAARSPDPRPPARFERKVWKREDPKFPDAGGGTMSLMRGQIFEKVGVHISTVYGEFSSAIRKQIPGTEKSPNFWASGISLIAHMRNPNVPAVHMNTRMIVTGKSWFGGGADLTPMLTARRHNGDPDTSDFHAALRKTCQAHEVADYDAYKTWCDRYFFLPHRNTLRGTGGIFYDNLRSKNWEADFNFTKDVGRTFLEIYPRIVKRNMDLPWGEEEKKEQMAYRAYYVEFNLLYDRGTAFGLQTGGNVEAILSSMPPTAGWL